MTIPKFLKDLKIGDSFRYNITDVDFEYYFIQRKDKEYIYCIKVRLSKTFNEIKIDPNYRIYKGSLPRTHGWFTWSDIVKKAYENKNNITFCKHENRHKLIFNMLNQIFKVVK